MFRPSLSRRDAILLLVGATLMHILSFAFPSSGSGSIYINTHSGSSFQDTGAQWEDDAAAHRAWDAPPDLGIKIHTVTVTNKETATTTISEVHTVVAGPTAPKSTDTATSLIHHAPGWTLFKNLYMSGGTLFIVSEHGEGQGGWPERRMMTSTGLPAENTPENIAMREPTEKDMQWITPAEAQRRWGGRVRVVEGNTVLVNEPQQFLRHYYHLVAELFFGIQSFWWGAFNPASTKYTFQSPEIDRIIYAHSNADGWRDGPGFNAYFTRAAYPSLTVEVQEDWGDRVIHSQAASEKVFLFPVVLLTDRSASHRGVICGSQTQRIAAEAHSYMELDKLVGADFWESVRGKMLSFAGVPPVEDTVVITYVSRQGVSRRKLTDESHTSLVTALEALVQRKNREYEDTRGAGGRKRWELTVMAAETMSKDAQIAQAARTTVMLGVHGNGLSHLLWMPPSTTSTEVGPADQRTTRGQRAVIEIFYPGGFAHDYHWTSRALGHAHYAVWDDKWYTHPDEPGVDYPEGFQENYIPVKGETVATIVERHVEGVRLESHGQV